MYAFFFFFFPIETTKPKPTFSLLNPSQGNIQFLYLSFIGNLNGKIYTLSSGLPHYSYIHPGFYSLILLKLILQRTSTASKGNTHVLLGPLLQNHSLLWTKSYNSNCSFLAFLLDSFSSAYLANGEAPEFCP